MKNGGGEIRLGASRIDRTVESIAARNPANLPKSHILKVSLETTPFTEIQPSASPLLLADCHASSKVTCIHLGKQWRQEANATQGPQATLPSAAADPLRLFVLADLAPRPALSANGSRVHLDECGQISRVRSLRAENARLRQEVEDLRAEMAQLGGENAEMVTLVKQVGRWVQGHREFPQELGRTAVDVQGELAVARGTLQAVLALHQDASGYCAHCRQPRRCPTMAAI